MIHDSLSSSVATSTSPSSATLTLLNRFDDSSAASSAGNRDSSIGSPIAMCARRSAVVCVTFVSPSTRTPASGRGDAIAVPAHRHSTTSARNLRALLLAGQDAHQLADDAEHDLVRAAADREDPG